MAINFDGLPSVAQQIQVLISEYVGIKVQESYVSYTWGYTRCLSFPGGAQLIPVNRSLLWVTARPISRQIKSLHRSIRREILGVNLAGVKEIDIKIPPGESLSLRRNLTRVYRHIGTGSVAR